MPTVLRWNGSATAAFGIHGLTALPVAVSGVLLVREQPMRPALAAANA